MYWVDIHCHLDMLKDPELSIKRALQNDVTKMITISTTLATGKKALEFSKKYPSNVYCTLGVHPHDASTFDIEVKKFILENAKNAVAIGEIGLDYYYEYSDRITQKQVFNEQLEIATELGLPVQIHTRDAEKDTIEILKKHKPKGVIHCFTGTKLLAEECLSLGMNIFPLVEF